MKFALFLKRVQDLAPPEYHGRFLNYKQLKKQIKYTDALDTDSRNNFLLALQDELERVNRVFDQQAAAIARARTHYHRWWDHWVCATPVGMHAQQTRAQRLLMRCFWCRHFAMINAAGLRKILKKYDKRLATREGAAYLQHCWQGPNLQLGSILHSPLLSQLLGLESLLRRTQGVVVERRLIELVEPNNTSGWWRQDVQTCEDSTTNAPPLDPPPLDTLKSDIATATTEPPPLDTLKSDIATATTVGSDTAAAGTATGGCGAYDGGDGCGAYDGVGGCGAYDPGGEGVHDEDDGYVSSDESEGGEEEAVQLKCPICLNWLYHPIGLSCGHTFCERCLLTTAHLDHMLGPLGSIMRRAPSNAHCPECRQTGVFENAMKLRELDELVRLKYPEEWRQQAAEAKTRRQRMVRRFLRQKIQKRACGFSDQDALQRTSVLLDQISSILTVGSPRSTSIPEWVRNEDAATSHIYQQATRHTHHESSGSGRPPLHHLWLQEQDTLTQGGAGTQAQGGGSVKGGPSGKGGPNGSASGRSRGNSSKVGGPEGVPRSGGSWSGPCGRGEGLIECEKSEGSGLSARGGVGLGGGLRMSVGAVSG